MFIVLKCFFVEFFSQDLGLHASLMFIIRTKLPQLRSEKPLRDESMRDKDREFVRLFAAMASVNLIVLPVKI